MQKRDADGKIIRKPARESFEKQPIIDKCQPCNLHDNSFCSIYLDPKTKWRLGNCLMATHLSIRISESRFKEYQNFNFKTQQYQIMLKKFFLE